MDKDHIEACKQIVEHGGALWIGLQEALSDDIAKAYVLFEAPLSGKLLMLPDNEFFTTQAVHEKVHAADRNFHFTDEEESI